jgi:hypothetical protein
MAGGISKERKDDRYSRYRPARAAEEKRKVIDAGETLGYGYQGVIFYSLSAAQSTHHDENGFHSFDQERPPSIDTRDGKPRICRTDRITGPPGTITEFVSGGPFLVQTCTPGLLNESAGRQDAEMRITEERGLGGGGFGCSETVCHYPRTLL